MSAQQLTDIYSASTLHRPPSPLYKELERKSHIFPGRQGIMEVDFGSGLFGVEFPVGGDARTDVELAKTSRRFPLAGVEKFQFLEGDSTETARKVFYFNASGTFARGSGILTFNQMHDGKKRLNAFKIRLEVE